MRLMSATLAAGMGALAFGPAVAQVDPLAPLPTAPATQAPAVQLQPRPIPQPVPAQPFQVVMPRPSYTAPTGFAAYKLYLAGRARAEGVREATIQANAPGLDLNSRAIQLDQSQPGGPPNSSYIPPFSPYQRRHVTPDLIRRGQAR